MNRLTIVGNLTRDPELRTTSMGVNVCSFDVAVNRRKKIEGQPEADFFHVTVWRGLAEVCREFLTKSSKVAVTGTVAVSTYQASDGSTRASLDVNADEVEFLSSMNR